MRLPIFYVVLLLIVVNKLSGQNSDRISAYDYILDINNIEVSLDPSGAIGYGEANPPMFHVPAGSTTSPLYGAWFWLAGKDQEGVVRAFAPSWSNLEEETHFGPYNSNAALYTPEVYALKYIPYNRVWKVTKQEIETHKLQYANAGYIIPDAILNWPGNGNVADGFSEQIAPYVDVNNNFIYEPLSGDYPLIKGDAAIFAMYHDNTFYEAEMSQNKNLNFEVHVLIYAFEASENTYLDNSLFVNYTIINKGDFVIDSLYGGAFADLNIGYYSDDYCGSDSSLNLFFGYNGDLTDGPGIDVYTTLPAFGCVTLSHPLNAFMYFNNDFSPMGFPDIAEHYLYALQGKFGDGMRVTSGGDGYSAVSTDYTNYMYGGDVHDMTAWSEIYTGNTPSDRRGAGSFYLGAFGPGASTCVTVGYVYADAEIPESLTASIDLLKMQSNQLKTFFELNDSSSCLERTYIPLDINEAATENYFRIFPNPAEGELTISCNGITKPFISVTLFNATGQLIIKQQLTVTAGSNDFHLDTKQLNTGAYFIKIADGDITTVKTVIIK